MAQRLIPFALVLVLAFPAMAETAEEAMNQEWVAHQLAFRHFGEALAVYVRAAQKAAADAANSEERLKWLLDNPWWLKGEAAPEAKP